MRKSTSVIGPKGPVVQLSIRAMSPFCTLDSQLVWKDIEKLVLFNFSLDRPQKQIYA